MFASKTTSKPESNLIIQVRAAISHHALIARGDKVIVGVSGKKLGQHCRIVHIGVE